MAIFNFHQSNSRSFTFAIDEIKGQLLHRIEFADVPAAQQRPVITDDTDHKHIAARMDEFDKLIDHVIIGIGNCGIEVRFAAAHECAESKH
ncbi:hypothetical protein SB4_15355 [Sphingomonas sanguinis]|uniref:Uncharacterized protein n=1 Tax=Sphingomonas sanguinis TaxID=33051 RepID=A0A147IMP0_9SPHN|nr:hypothetical protein SB4_15355 [Sphingomonas sanguinis]